MKDKGSDLEEEVQVYFPAELFFYFFERPFNYSKLSDDEILRYLCEVEIPVVIATPLKEDVKNGFESIVSISPEVIYSGVKMNERKMFEEGEVINDNYGHTDMDTQFNKILYEAWRRNLFPFENWREQLAERRIEYFIEMELPIIRRKRKFGRRNNLITKTVKNDFSHNPFYN